MNDLDQVKVYGNTVRELRTAIIGGLAIGAFAAIAVFVTEYFEQRLRVSSIQDLLLALSALPGISVAFILPTLLFQIRVVRGRVQHVFLRRFVMSDYPITDFTKFKRAHRGCAVVLFFRGGQKIHFFGAKKEELIRLECDLPVLRDGAAAAI